MGPSVNIMDFNIGPKKMFKVHNGVYLRHYDPAIKIFTLIDQDLNLEELCNEIVSVKSKADNWVKTNCIYPY